MKSPIVLLMGLIQDIERLHCGVKGLDKDLSYIQSRFENEGNSFLTITLPILCDALDQGLARGEFTCPRHFKPVPRGRIPRIFSGIFCEVFEMRTGLLKEHASVEGIISLRQILRFFKKVTSSNLQADLLDRKAKDDFKKADDSLAGIEFDPRREHLLSRVCQQVLLDLGLPNLEELDFKHGPGAVYERVTANQKWFAVVEGIFSESFDLCTYGLDTFGTLERESIDATPRAHYGYVGWSLRPTSVTLKCFVSRDTDSSSHEEEQVYSEEAFSERESSPRILIQGDFSGIISRKQDENLANGSWFPLRSDDSKSLINGLRSRISRLVSVEKNSSSRRTITVEPVLLQFLQQGLNGRLRQSIIDCPILGVSLDLSDQIKSQTLALEGSRTGAWDTLDLSSASDLLSNKLVHCVFNSKPEFLSGLQYTRSLSVEGDENRQLLKYAGMGNATTFPVQSVVFACLALAAIMDSQGFRPTKSRLKHAARCLRVYGDDIIVRSEYTRHVIEWITAFGLRVNEKKSFFSGRFRESCGVDAFMGIDVTPVYMRADPFSISKDPSTIAKLVAISNSLFMRGYYKASELVKEEVEKRLKSRLPLTSSTSGVLGWHTRKNVSSVSRWNSTLQRFELRSFAVVSKNIADPIDGYAALLKFFLVPLIGRGKDHLKVSSKKFSTRISRRWVPV